MVIGRDRKKEFAAAGVSVVGILGAMVAPLWALQLGLIAMSGWVAWWVWQCPIDRLALSNRLPNPFVFSLIGLGIFANRGVVVFLESRAIGLTVSLVMLVVALAVGVLRIVLTPMAPCPKLSIDLHVSDGCHEIAESSPCVGKHHECVVFIKQRVVDASEAG